MFSKEAKLSVPVWHSLVSEGDIDGALALVDWVVGAFVHTLRHRNNVGWLSLLCIHRI